MTSEIGTFMATEKVRMRETICRPEIASALFEPNVDAPAIEAFVSAIVNRLKHEPQSIRAIARIRQMPAQQAEEWALQCWMNSLTQIAKTDAVLQDAIRSRGTYVPMDDAGFALYMQKLKDAFNFFVVVVGWGGQEGDMSNYFLGRFISLESTIMIENLQVRRQGRPCGWGFLDSVVSGVRSIAKTTGQQVRTIATSDQMEASLRRRGFVLLPRIEGELISDKARPMALSPG